MVSALIYVLLLAGGMVIVGLILELYVPSRPAPLKRLMLFHSPRWSALPERRQYPLIVVSIGLFNAAIVLGALILSRVVFGKWDAWDLIVFGLALWISISFDAIRHQRRFAITRANPLSSTDEHPQGRIAAR